MTITTMQPVGTFERAVIEDLLRSCAWCSRSVQGAQDELYRRAELDDVEAPADDRTRALETAIIDLQAASVALGARVGLAVARRAHELASTLTGDDSDLMDLADEVGHKSTALKWIAPIFAAAGVEDDLVEDL